MARRLQKDFPEIKFSVSATTRRPRSGEKNGVDYHFFSNSQFNKHIEEDKFLEWEEFYNGTRYGTLKADVESKLNKGYFIMLDIDVLGALNVKKMYGDDALSIFISPPSLSILEERLRSRGTESEEALAVRLKRALKEIEYADRFDIEVLNNELDSAYEQIKNAVFTFITNS